MSSAKTIERMTQRVTTLVAEFETRLHNHYNLALMMEMLAQGQVEVQQMVLEDGSIILDVTDYAFGG